MDQALKQENIPSGGIADFIYTDEEIKLLEDKEIQDLYGENGIAQFKTIGKEMANFGRYGDDTIAHVETGELIVPRALIESNPKLKESIFGHLRELGVEDPERYVVGTSKNSLNPDTGLPEFFLKKLLRGVRKTVSKVGKGVSKALKSVGKSLKKVAPVIVPLALNYFLPGLGAVYSGALGAGITSLMQGASVKDALKSALVGGATGAVTAGFAGPNKGVSGFGQNIAADVGGGTRNIQQALTQGSFKPLTSTSLPSLQDVAKQDTDILQSDTLASTTTGDGVQQANLLQKQTPTLMDDAGNFYASEADFAAGRPLPPELRSPSGEVFTRNQNIPKINLTDSKTPSMFEKLSKTPDYLFRGGKTVEEVTLAQDSAERKYLANALSKGITPTQAGIDAARSAAGPSFIERFGPSAALAGAGLYAGGAFDAPEDEPTPDVYTGLDRYREDPDKFKVGDLRVRGADTPIDTRTSFGFNYNPYLFPTQPFQTVAEGGEIFPRRNGGISPREGTPGKDSVRAMLMPGEFVMTTDAVKGLGDGNLDKGIKNMYSVMSKLEKRGKAMA